MNSELVHTPDISDKTVQERRDRWASLEYVTRKFVATGSTQTLKGLKRGTEIRIGEEGVQANRAGNEVNRVAGIGR